MSSSQHVQEFFSNVASKELVAAVQRAIVRARDGECRHVYLAHLILELLDEATVEQSLPVKTRNEARSLLQGQLSGLPSAVKPTFAFNIEALLQPAQAWTKKWTGASLVSPPAFLATCLNSAIEMDIESQRSRELLRSAGLTLESFMPAPVGQTDLRQRDFRFGLLGYGTDLTAMAAAHFWPTCPVVGMENELRKVIKVLNAKAQSVILTAEAGVGKSTLVEGLAYKIVHGDANLVPHTMKSWTIVMIQSSDIIKGAGVVGGLEREMKKMLDFFRTNPTVIPFFDEIHSLLDTSDDNLKAIANSLKPPMANGMFRCIGATTNREYARFVAGDDAIRSRFNRVQIVEPTEDEAVRIIVGSAQRLLEGRASELGINVGRDAIEAAVRVTSIYMRTERLPRKAVKLLEKAVYEKIYEIDMASTRDDPQSVSGSDVMRVFSEQADIPVTALQNDRTEYFKQLGDRLSRRVVGQQRAVNSVTRWLNLQSKGWFDSKRPRGRFVFTGPPGVGKTELARALADELIRDPEALITLDMGDYGHGEMSVAKFMGAAEGYVGYGQSQTLYTRVMTRPYSVVLLDEFDKCDPALSNPLLSILDGFAADSRGNRVDFSQTIIIMTSNSLASATTESEQADDSARRALRGLKGEPIWTAPLLDRVDKICQFSPLGNEHLALILRQLIDRRKFGSSQELPPRIFELAAQAEIIAAAVQDGGNASARRLERALLNWLDSESQNQ